MNTTTRLAAAALFGLGFAGAAHGEQTGPRLVGSGENISVEYSGPSANIVGGALTRIAGSGESTQSQVISVEAVQPGRVARIVGSGENQEVIYQDAMPVVRVARGG